RCRVKQGEPALYSGDRSLRLASDAHMGDASMGASGGEWKPHGYWYTCGPTPCLCRPPICRPEEPPRPSGPLREQLRFPATIPLRTPTLLSRTPGTIWRM